uniref:non-ribosomal peptide synthetase n=1 Tax=Bacillus thuringiensis TaxID=1428 RepID=UPI003A84A79F
MEYKERKEINEKIRNLLEKKMRESKNQSTKKVKRNKETNEFPLSYGQKQLWFLENINPGSCLYNIPEAMRLKGSFNVSALESSINDIIKRHEILRTSFIEKKGEPMQIVNPFEFQKLHVKDLTHLPNAERENMVDQIISQESKAHFNLSERNLFRFFLIRLSDNEHILVLNMHHIIYDGWSRGIFWNELSCLYQEKLSNLNTSLEELKIQYGDFAILQEEWLKSEKYIEQKSFWKKNLENLPLLQLPTDNPRPLKNRYQGNVVEKELPKELLNNIRSFNQKEGTTTFITMLAAYKMLIYKYTGQKDFAIGCPISVRNQSELEFLIGFFVNTLILRDKIEENLSFLEFLRIVKETTLAAYDNQDFPYERLVDLLQPDRNLSFNPLFQVAVSYQKVTADLMEIDGLEMSTIDAKNYTAKLDISLFIIEKPSGLKIKIEYNTDLFNESTMVKMIDNLEFLLNGIVSEPERLISEFSIVNQTDRNIIIDEFNKTDRVCEGPNRIHTFFEQTARKFPENIAIELDDYKLSYRELNEKANQLAHYLKGKGMQKEQLIGISMERSVDMVIAILGVLKVGGAYVPLDPSYPQERLEYMLKDSNLDIVITQKHNVSKFNKGIQTITIDNLSELKNYSVENPSVSIYPNSLAYIIYTSGSTGTPKGVMIEHKGICNLVEFQATEFNITNNDRILQFASPSFDASVWEIFLALTTGATLCVLPQNSNKVELDIGEYIDKYAVTTCLLPPSVLSILSLDKVGSLKKVIVGGESCPIEVAKKWSKGRQFWNAYGPTESTVCATIFKFHEECEQLPIGKPISNTKVYVLDPNMQVVPIGVPGELYVSGIGIAR